MRVNESEGLEYRETMKISTVNTKGTKTGLLFVFVHGSLNIIHISLPPFRVRNCCSLINFFSSDIKKDQLKL